MTSNARMHNSFVDNEQVDSIKFMDQTGEDNLPREHEYAPDVTT